MSKALIHDSLLISLILGLTWFTWKNGLVVLSIPLAVTGLVMAILMIYILCRIAAGD